MNPNILEGLKEVQSKTYNMATKATSAAVCPKNISLASKRSPFRATKLWNQLLSSFKEGMQLKRKRWRLKSYDQCFSGADAIQWLYGYLQDHPSFGAHVTREQTFMLLQKFLENNVFQGVAVKSCNKFQDTNYLYRFVEDAEKIKNNKIKEAITTKEDKENFNSGNSLTNLMRTISKRNSGKLLDLNPPESQTRQNSDTSKQIAPLVKENDMKVEDKGSNSSGCTPLAKNLNDMSLMKNIADSSYSKFSTLLFESDEEDEVFETSIRNHFFTRSNSLQTWKKGTQPSVRQPLGTFWINEYNKTESECSNINNNKNSEKKKVPRNFGKASLYNFKKNRILRKRKSGDVGAKFSSKLKKLTEEVSSYSRSQESISSGSSNPSLTRSLESMCSESENGPLNRAGSQNSISDPLPPKALAILGEDPSHIHEVESYSTYQVSNTNFNFPVHRKHKLSPIIKSKSKSHQDTGGSIGKISNDHNQSYCNLLLNDDLNSLSSHDTITPDRTEMTNIKGTIKKAKSFSFLDPYSNVEKNNCVKTRKPARRTHAMIRRSISQNSLRRRTYGSQQLSTDIEEQGYPFNCSTESVDKNRLYKVPSSWSIDTIGLINEVAKEDVPEITVDDVEEMWKTVLILSLKKILGVDSIKDFFDTSQVNGANIMKNVSWNSSEISHDTPGWLLSAMNCLIDWPKISKDAEDSILQELPSYPGFERDVYRAVKEHYHTTLTKPLIPEHLYPLVQECADALHENKDKGIKIMQHIILLLPCWNRRQLQLLIHFMSKVSTNYLLEISNDLPNRDLVIHSFLQLIVRKGKHAFTLEAAIKPMRITNMLIDSYDIVFKAPPSLRGQVDHKLAILLGRPSTVEETPASRNVSAEAAIDLKNGPHFYCKQITKAAYEKEAKENYHKAINDLLTAYVTDLSFSEKERRKRLKQFQKAYPEIYAERFSCDDLSNCSTISEFSTNFKHAIKPSFLSEKIL